MSLTHSERLRKMAAEGEVYDQFLADCAAHIDRLQRVIDKVMLADEAFENGQSFTGTIMLADAVFEYRKMKTQ